MSKEYHICTKCVMDTSDPSITFDNNGVCNHCIEVEKKLNEYPHNLDRGNREFELKRIAEKIKLEGKNREYDCVIGVSGGVDSTYLAYIVKGLGLRPLAVHLDNGWDSELAVHNIEKVLKTLEIELYTYVIDWEEFKDLQLSFLKASTPDAEVPTDHAIVAILYQVAVETGVRYVIIGTNVISEAILPSKWSYGHADFKYIKNVHKQFGTKYLNTYPHYSLLKLFYYKVIKGIKLVPILNYIHYDKKEAMEILIKTLGWVYYGGKHYESIYTRFFQTYILPVKFNIDKRKAHFSNLICSGQLTRDEALEELKADIYPEEKIKEDRNYVIKKMGLTENEFEKIMTLPVKTFTDYPSYEKSWYYGSIKSAYRIYNKLSKI